MQIFSIKYDKPNSTTYSKDHSHDEVDFIPRREGWFKPCKSTKVRNYITRFKDRNK